jgi:hypothetical protein
MADNQTPRPYRTTEQTRASGAAASGSDPLAELARLIGQTDPFGEFGRDDGRRAAAAPATNFSGADYFDAPSAPPPSAQPPAYAPPPRARQSSVAAGDQFPPPPGHPPGEHAGYEADPYHPGGHQFAHEDEHFYEDATRSKRRMGVLAIAAVFALAVIGTAGAFGYRAIFGKHSSGPPPVIKADATPSKIVPAATSKTPNKLIYDRVSDQSAGEKLVSRQESPVEVKAADIPMAPPLAGAPPQGAVQPAPGSGVIATEPKKVHTIAIHPDQLGNMQTAVAAPPPPQPAAPASIPAPRQMASDPPAAVASPAPPEAPRMPEARPSPQPPAHRVASAPPNAPLSLSPNAPAPPTAHVAGGYSVQVSSQRSEAEAQAAFRGLQTKYPKILGGRHAAIHKVELGSKGTYYRALVGPFASANEASELCNGLRAAGGQCLIQRN